ncbi:MAG: class I SAM-dependent methyltransferase [Chloroflexi bacterium]|nr:class I SAM-dependent methyltransferase [Chloroflexota bacterium]
MPSDPLRPSPALVAAAWGRRVQANREQVERMREDDPDPDHYAPIVRLFRGDPNLADDPTWDALRPTVGRDETWLDIGAGGGRLALPLARHTREVIALDPSPGMVNLLHELVRTHQLTNVRVVEGRWPAAAPLAADVAFVSHVGYDVEQIGPFVEAMEANARRRCVAILLERAPPYPFDELWPAVHGEQRAPLPALPEFLTLLLARGRLFEVQFTQRWAQVFPAFEDLLALARRQLWTRPGSAADERLRAALAERVVRRDGGFAASARPARLGIVSWTTEGPR